jgi:hypothetical protein
MFCARFFPPVNLRRIKERWLLIENGDALLAYVREGIRSGDQDVQLRVESVPDSLPPFLSNLLVPSVVKEKKWTCVKFATDLTWMSFSFLFF